MRRIPSGFMPHGMVAPSVALFANPIKQCRMPLNVIPYTKERGLLTPLSQLIENKRRPFGMRTIIKSQMDCLRLSSPKELREHRGNSNGNAGTIHISKFAKVLLSPHNSIAFSHPFAGVSSRSHRAGNGIRLQGHRGQMAGTLDSGRNVHC